MKMYDRAFHDDYRNGDIGFVQDSRSNAKRLLKRMAQKARRQVDKRAARHAGK
jgi:hypothetical protein